MELLPGRKVDFRKDLALSFGQYLDTYEQPSITNIMDAKLTVIHRVYTTPDAHGFVIETSQVTLTFLRQNDVYLTQVYTSDHHEHPFASSIIKDNKAKYSCRDMAGTDRAGDLSRVLR